MAKARKWDTVGKQVYELRQTGLTMKECAEKLGITPAAAHALSMTYNVNKDVVYIIKQPKIWEALGEQAYALYQSGKQYGDIAKEMNETVPSVKYILLKHKQHMKKTNPEINTTYVKPQPMWQKYGAQIESMRSEGVTVKGVAKLLNIPESAVCRIRWEFKKHKKTEHDINETVSFETHGRAFYRLRFKENMLTHKIATKYNVPIYIIDEYVEKHKDKFLRLAR